MTQPTVIEAGRLAAFATEIFRAAGVPLERAAMAAESLVAANLRGVDSHGIQLLSFYVEQILAGDVDPAAAGEVASQAGSCVVYDGHNGLGQSVAHECCRIGVELTREHGLSLVVARESNHFGAAAWWAQKYSAVGLIGLVFCNASPIVPPWQGREGRIGTNPICMSVPGGAEPPWLLDMATTTVAAGKVYKASLNGQQTIPPGWALDSEGSPTTSVEEALRGLIAPLGGYKGSGLAMMVEVLCAVLGGGAMSTELGGIRVRGRPMRPSQAFIGIDIARFLPPDEFKARMDWLIRRVKDTPPGRGYSEVLVAGEPELRAEEIRRREGIPIEPGNWEALTNTARRLGVDPPDLG